MLKYAKIINEATKQCEVGVGRNTEFYKSIGMTEMEVEQAYDGSWYVKSYAPEKSQEVKENEVRAVRNSCLQATDIYMLPDFPITDEEREEYKNYRRYLRNYPSLDDWWKAAPMNFEEWREVIINDE